MNAAQTKRALKTYFVITNYISMLVGIAALAATILLAVPMATAQTFTRLRSFSVSDGGSPYGGLTLSDGMLCGINNALFKISTNGTGFAILHTFTGGSDGALPIGRVVVSSNTIYGVTYRGGTNNTAQEGGGVIYRVNTDGGGYSILRRLDSKTSDGYKPNSGMVLVGSTLYGTTTQGGFSTRGTSDRGTVFKINTDGFGYQNIHSFSGYEDGQQPETELTLIGNTLFGTSAFSQFGSAGPVLFRVGLDETGFTVLYTFPTSFAQPGHLTPVGNSFYGVGLSYQTGEGLASVYKINTNGSGFQIVHQWPVGFVASSDLIWTGSRLLGSVGRDSLDPIDQIFQVNTNGTGYRVLRTFSASELSGLGGGFALSGTSLYGTSLFGGETNRGTLFTFDMRPRLAIAAASNSTKISWPSYAYDYQLEQSPTPASSTWTNVATVPADNGTNWMLTLPAPTASNSMFHRLRR